MLINKESHQKRSFFRVTHSVGLKGHQKSEKPDEVIVIASNSTSRRKVSADEQIYS